MVAHAWNRARARRATTATAMAIQEPGDSRMGEFYPDGADRGLERRCWALNGTLRGLRGTHAVGGAKSLSSEVSHLKPVRTAWALRYPLLNRSSVVAPSALLGHDYIGKPYPTVRTPHHPVPHVEPDPTRPVLRLDPLPAGGRLEVPRWSLTLLFTQDNRLKEPLEPHTLSYPANPDVPLPPWRRLLKWRSLTGNEDSPVLTLIWVVLEPRSIKRRCPVHGVFPHRAGRTGLRRDDACEIHIIGLHASLLPGPSRARARAREGTKLGSLGSPQNLKRRNQGHQVRTKLSGTPI